MGLHNDSAGARDTINTGPLNDVVGMCEQFDADVLVLQEAYWWRQTSGEQRPGEADRLDLIDEVATAVGGTAHRFGGDVPDSYPVPWTIAVISRLPATRLADLRLPARAGQDRAMIRLRLDDHQVVLGCGHHDGVHSLRRCPDLWFKQMQVLRGAAADNDAIIGDMNMWGPVLARALPGMRRAVRGKTWPAWRPHSQIDHILVNDRLQVVQGEVLPNMQSDHLPIKATLRI